MDRPAISIGLDINAVAKSGLAMKLMPSPKLEAAFPAHSFLYSRPSDMVAEPTGIPPASSRSPIHHALTWRDRSVKAALLQDLAEPVFEVALGSDREHCVP